MKKTKLQRIKELQGVVLAIEMDLKLLDDDLDTVTKHITYLKRLENDLIYNINLHRSDQVISVVTEYKKSLNELDLVRQEMSKQKSKIAVIKNRIDRKMKAYDYYMQQFDQEFNRLNSEPVILLFRRNSDGK